MINDWLARWPNANWALRTGPETGFTVIDIDPRHGGYELVCATTADPWPDARHLEISNRRWRQASVLLDSARFRNPQVRGWLPGVDIQANGAYVILPEGREKSGAPYRWINWGNQATPLPRDIAKSIMNRPSSFSGGMSGDLADTATILQGVPEGERDDTLFRWACRLRRQLGDGGRRIVELAVLDAASRCMPPFPPNEALRKVEQAWRQDHSDRVPDSRRLVAGGDFVLDEPETIPAVWGDGERVLWTEGEGVMITGHQGVGKTTVAQQLVLHRIGLRAGDFLGLPVSKSDRPILYLAMHRPRQAARSLRRMVAESDRQLLNEQLVVWRGPLPVDPTKDKDQFADFAEEICPNVGTIIADSVRTSRLASQTTRSAPPSTCRGRKS